MARCGARPRRRPAPTPAGVPPTRPRTIPMQRRLLLAASLVLSSVAVAAEPDWPRFRGPKLDNKSPDTGLLKAWPEDGPPVAWKATDIGSGYSSVTVAGDRVFTVGNK